MVVLNRLQSGVGALTIQAVCSPAVGDIRIGALYELSDGTATVLENSQGLSVGPPGSRTPVLTAGREQFDEISADLRQSRSIERLLVYAHSDSGQELQWGGTLVVRTFGGARVEIPLDLGRHHGPLALMSLYSIEGEFVLRAESEKVRGAVRDVALAFGYDRITWVDQRTPVV